jgi:hypothetical protein
MTRPISGGWMSAVQATVTQDDEMIQTVPSDRINQAFANKDFAMANEAW